MIKQQIYFKIKQPTTNNFVMQNQHDKLTFHIYVYVYGIIKDPNSHSPELETEN